MPREIKIVIPAQVKHYTLPDEHCNTCPLFSTWGPPDLIAGSFRRYQCNRDSENLRGLKDYIDFQAGDFQARLGEEPEALIKIPKSCCNTQKKDDP